MREFLLTSSVLDSSVTPSTYYVTRDETRPIVATMSITPNPPRWQPSTDPASIVVPGLDANASFNDQIDQIEQLITIKLQVILTLVFPLDETLTSTSEHRCELLEDSECHGHKTATICEAVCCEH